MMCSVGMDIVRRLFIAKYIILYIIAIPSKGLFINYVIFLGGGDKPKDDKHYIKL